MNPELRRNLWLQMTGGRIAVGASLVGVLLAAALVVDVRFNLESFDVTRWVSRGTYVFVVLLWGGRTAAAAVVQEVRERTWDWQRMSAVGAWTMTIGKLAGATSLSWMLGLLCLTVYAATGLMTPSAAEIPAEVARYLGLGLFVQAFAMMLSLLRVSRVPGYQPANVTVVHLMALGAVLILSGFVGGIGQVGGLWYGMAAENVVFAALTLWFFGAWCVVGVYRRMRRELQFRTVPWLWIVFLFTLAAYAYGLEGRLSVAWPVPYVSLFVAILLVFYVVLLFEPKMPGAIHYLFSPKARPAGLARALANTPLWFLTFLFLALTTLFIALSAPADGVDFWRATGVTTKAYNGLAATAFAQLLFTCRDLMILFILLNRKERFEPEVVAFVIWFVLYGPLPAILLAGKLEGIMVLFWPDVTAPLEWMLMAPAIEALVAGAIALLIWRRNRSMSEPEEKSADRRRGGSSGRPANQSGQR